MISKADKAGIHLFEEFKLATLSTDGELLKFFTITCFVLNRFSLVESAPVILFLALTSSCSMIDVSALYHDHHFSVLQVFFSALVGIQLTELLLLSLVPKTS